ncbi:MAG: FAD-binding oxidoreductase [Bacteroidota bacterium]
MGKLSKISNWGNYPRVEAEVDNLSIETKIGSGSVIARGTGLSYGDASLSSHIISTLKFNKIISFDTTTGVIFTEAGATLDEVLRTIVPKGWFLPVTPGTKFVTVGGAVAGDVHGKNHHSEGSFCNYVKRLDMMMADGSVVSCGPNERTDLFKTVCGGLGLSGIILRVEFTLKKIETAYIQQTNVVIRNLDEMIDRLKQFNSTTYTVAWVDALARGKKLGRGVLMLGEHATEDEIEKDEPLKVHTDPLIRVPMYAPGFILNQLSVGAFNFAFYNKHKLASRNFTVHYDPYFYPLDFVRDWNKLYGRRGFLQYQFVIPFEAGAKGLREIIDAIAKEGASSFLTVLKALGPSDNLISFPMPGYTLALDFPVSKTIFPFLDRLDKTIIDLGGRIYLVKDARMSSEVYWKGYPQAPVFKDMVKKFDPEGKFASNLSQRLKMI